MKNKVIIICFAFLLAGGEIYCSTKKLRELDAEIKTKSTELRKIEANIRQKRRARDDEKKKEEIFRKEIRRIDAASSALAARQRKTKKRIKRAQRNLQAAKNSLGIAKDAVASRDADFKKTINNIWLARSSFKLISLKNDDIEIRDIIMHKKRRYDAARENEQRCKDAVERWLLAKNELTDLERKLEENLQQQKNLKKEKRKLLTDARGRRVAIEKEIKSLNETSAALHNMILGLEKSKKKMKGRMEKEAQARKKVALLQGNIPWPARGDVVLKFGKNKRDDIGAPVISNGIKIKTLPRTEVVAVSSGECVFAGHFRKYGNMVVVDHGGGFYSVYGLLGEINVKKDSKITAGQKIGVSDSGEGLVYFEFRVDGQPVDPLLWLKK